MKIILLSAFIFLAAIWSGAVALGVALVRASASLLQSADGDAVARVASEIPIPDWLAPWVDLAGWREWVQWIAALRESLGSALPALGQLLDWLEPLAWSVWAVGMIGLIVLTFVGSRIMSRLSR